MDLDQCSLVVLVPPEAGHARPLSFLPEMSPAITPQNMEIGTLG